MHVPHDPSPHRTRRATLLAALFVLVWLAFNLWSLLRYPGVNCDESFYLRSGMQYTRALFGPGVWPQGGALFYLPHGRVYWLLVTAAAAIGGVGIVSLRVLSLIGWGLAAWAAHVAARQFTGSVRAARWAAALLASSWLGLYVGHNARPDILATAAGAAVAGVAWWALREPRSARTFLLLGLLITLQLDLHLNLLHLAWPVGLYALIVLLKRRRFDAAALLVLGALLGGVIVAALHLGGAAGDVLAYLLRDPLAYARGYVSPGASGSGVGASALGVLASFGRFWWSYYAWLAPWLALPQAALFLLGLGWGLTSRQPGPRALAWLVVASSLSFAVVNSRYQALYYAMLWMPLYLILGAGAVLDLGARLADRRPALGPLPAAVLGGLLALYVAGDVRLALPRPAAEYQRAADEMLDGLPADSRVLTSSTWWFPVERQAAFVDEYALGRADGVMWWNAVPDEAALDGLREVGGSAVSAADAPALVAARLAELRPDVIVDDQRIGCFSSVIPLSEALTAEAEANCTPLRTVTTEHYGTHTVYTCDWGPSGD